MQQFTRSLTREIVVGGERLAITLSKEGLSVRPVGGRRPPHNMSWEACLHACITGVGQEPTTQQVEEALKAVRAGGPKSAEKETAEGKTAAPDAKPTSASASGTDKITMLLGRLDHWLNAHRNRFQQALRPGASAAECDELSAALGKPFPEELRSLLTWHNGQNADVPGSFQDNWILMSTQEIAAAKKELDAQPHEGWRTDWVPFLDDDGGNYRCLDLSAGGCPVVECWRGRADHPAVAPSLAAWLEDFVRGLESGAYAEDTERGILARRSG